jgi:hypothetical protein
MTITEQIEEVGTAGLGLIPTVAVGIGLGIILSIVPVLLLSAGLKITDSIFDRVVN